MFAGAFTTDPQSRMSWFQPLSLEPLYKFELLGLLMGLAIYNGLTLPVNFPLALYMYLLEYRVSSLDSIEDGWPELAKGLRALQSWSEGDVAGVFMRTYTFSMEVFGTAVDIDMDARRRRHEQRSTPGPSGQKKEETTNPEDFDEADYVNLDVDQDDQEKGTKAPSHRSRSSSASITDSSSIGESSPFTKASSSRSKIVGFAHANLCSTNGVFAHPLNYRPGSPTKSTPMVTNANRDQYIKDYIHYLTYNSVRPQLSAFKSGFNRCVDKTSLELFEPRLLKTLVEGHREISTQLLQDISRYDGGYFRSHRSVQEFWKIVHGWGKEEGEAGQSKVRKLLEFVTASDRLPVGGEESITFVVQKNGVGDERLPTSLTCFGRLLLPEYSDIEAMRKGLERAIEEAKGFGVP